MNKGFSSKAREVIEAWADRCAEANDHIYAARLRAAAVSPICLSHGEHLMLYVTVFQPAEGDLVRDEVKQYYHVKPGPGGVELTMK